MSKGSTFIPTQSGIELLESGIATNVISEILGHTSPLSLNPYIDADLVHLRECGLDISSFPVRKEVFI